MKPLNKLLETFERISLPTAAIGVTGLALAVVWLALSILKAVVTGGGG